MSCLTCEYFDPLHFECNDMRQGLIMEEVEADLCLEVKSCSTGNASKHLDYWEQRATNAEAYIQDLGEINETEALRNNLPASLRSLAKAN